MTTTLEVVGYFSFNCQADGYCTFGCGKRPQTVCLACVEHEIWLEGITVPANFHPIKSDGSVYVDICDLCDEAF